ncbi:TRAP transporter small permease [Pseudalkalibacillus hwajinpoensis]|uniref:TRAP transporter small permease n=1 Tax=Guptibacillus hwajinpoensis TaxID=208199 RepID=UPI00325BBCD1
MNTLRGFLKNVEELAACVFFLIMCSAVMLGVCARLFNLSIVWTDELARYSFIWVVFIGSAAVLKRNQHITIEFLSTVLPELGQKYLRTIIGLILMGIFIVLIRYGVLITQDTWSVPSTSLGIPTGLVYLAIPISGTLMLFYTIIDLIATWKNDGGPTSEKREVNI